jgi:NADPH:quinone reductase-like Zn-dependent oxidoreductase
MNAAVVSDYATPPTFTTFDDPIAQSGEALVQVTAAGLHQIVKSLASGSHYGATGQFPFIPGVDAVGRLLEPLGDRPAGTRVYFGLSRPPFGTFAELGLASSTICIPLPDALSDATAAAIANPGMSSRVALLRAHFQPGTGVLILGATGVAGQLAVQIAKRRGASHVIAAGRNPEALAKLPSLGADTVISLDQPAEALVENFRAAIAATPISTVLDYVYGPPAEAALNALAKKGLTTASSRVSYVNIGSTAGANISLPAATLRSANIEILGSGFGSASLDQIRSAVIEFFAEAAVTPFDISVKTAPLSDIATLWSEKEQATRLVFLP